MTGETPTQAAGQVGGADAVVRESGAVGLVEDHRSSQGDSLMDGPGGGTGLTGELTWRGWEMGLAGLWPWPSSQLHSGHTL